ncbi:transposase (plasmid) [Deinococcus sp. D7000]|nr:transposase [Deinococcus sp. D7000]
MKGKRSTEQQILDILGQLEAGTAVSDLMRLHGVAMTTIYRWKTKYGGLSRDNTRKFRQLEDENRRLKKLVADLSLDHATLKEVPLAKVVAPGTTSQAQTPLKKQMVSVLQGAFEISERRACRALGFSSTTQRRNSPKRVKDLVLIERLRVLASERSRFGYRRLHLLLKRDGLAVNHKRVYRVYRAEGLAVRQKVRRRLAAVARPATRRCPCSAARQACGHARPPDQPSVAGSRWCSSPAARPASWCDSTAPPPTAACRPSGRSGLGS